MEHLITALKRFWLIYRRLKITVNRRKSARRNQDQEGMIFKNFKDRSDSVNLGQLRTILWLTTFMYAEKFEMFLSPDSRLAAAIAIFQGSLPP